jgi:hypothetical protein
MKREKEPQKKHDSGIDKAFATARRIIKSWPEWKRELKFPKL